MSRVALVVTLLLAAGSVVAGEAFDWDRYHDRQDACRELSAAQLACATYGLTAATSRGSSGCSAHWGSPRVEN